MRSCTEAWLGRFEILFWHNAHCVARDEFLEWTVHAWYLDNAACLMTAVSGHSDQEERARLTNPCCDSYHKLVPMSPTAGIALIK